MQAPTPNHSTDTQIGEDESMTEKKKPERWIKWDEWAEKNAKPKMYKLVRRKMERTRFQKAGPMSLADWERFDSWARKRSRPKGAKTRKQRRKLRQARLELKKKPVMSMERLMPRIIKLSTPKVKNCKHVYPPPPVYPFMPTIHNHKGPRKTKPRKMDPYLRLGKSYLDPDAEAAFWRSFRFPVSRNALKYKISKSIKALAAPKARPPKEHCPIPEEPEPEPRIKMGRSQWLWHQRHLHFLAHPKLRLDPPKPRLPRREKRPIGVLMQRIDELAMHKLSKMKRDRSARWAIRGPTLHCVAAPRVVQLAQSKYQRNKVCSEMTMLPVSKKALAANASSRVKTLATPKHDFSPTEQELRKRYEKKLACEIENTRCALELNRKHRKKVK